MTQQSRLNQDKVAVLNVIRSRLLEMKRQAELGMEDAQREANSHIGAMQSRYDTFKEEAQSLAAGHRIRLIGLQDDLAVCEALIQKLSDADVRFAVVEMGAFFMLEVEVEGEKRIHGYFLVPDGAGMAACLDGVNVMCVAPQAPVVAPFMGLGVDDDCEFLLAGQEAVGVVLKVE